MRRTNERGYTLLEYIAGAALLLAIVVAVMASLETGFTDMADDLEGWLTNQAIPAPVP